MKLEGSQICAVSMVYDGFNPLVPYPNQPYSVPVPQPPWGPVPSTGALITPIDLKQLLEAFHEAVEAAKRADKATGQSDCADPEKAKLEARVAELERRLDAMAEPKVKAKKPAKKSKLSGKAASR